uniref:Uncharacterized protein n=1 Tax=Arundo donax TaxID=35708 RepID=A0A0A9C1I1_ARUDO
MLMELMSSYMQ